MGRAPRVRSSSLLTLPIGGACELLLGMSQTSTELAALKYRWTRQGLERSNASKETARSALLGLDAGQTKWKEMQCPNSKSVLSSIPLGSTSVPC